MMKCYGKTSVVIPFYSEVSGLLVRAVRSALAQKYVAIEVIVVDDASPLNAKDELTDIVDRRLKIIKHEINRGGGIARNTGVQAAGGEFIAFLDYDDVWFDDKLVRQFEFYTSLQDTYQKPVVYAQCRIIDGSRSYIRPKRPIADGESVGEYLFVGRNIIQTSGIFLKRAHAIEAPFDDLKRHQDYQFCLALEAAGASFHMLEGVCYEFIQIPKKNDFEFSIKWLEMYSRFLTSNAIDGFRYLVIIRSMIANNYVGRAFAFSMKNRLLSKFIKSLSLYFVKNILYWMWNLSNLRMTSENPK